MRPLLCPCCFPAALKFSPRLKEQSVHPAPYYHSLPTSVPVFTDLGRPSPRTTVLMPVKQPPFPPSFSLLLLCSRFPPFTPGFPPDHLHAKDCPPIPSDLPPSVAAFLQVPPFPCRFFRSRTCPSRLFERIYLYRNLFLKTSVVSETSDLSPPHVLPLDLAPLSKP